MKKICSYVLLVCLLAQVFFSVTLTSNAQESEIMVNDSMFSYSDGWYKSSQRREELGMPSLQVHENDVHCNNQVGAWAEHSFTGNYVALFGETNSAHGSAKVELFEEGQQDPFYSEEISFQSESRLGKQKVFEKNLNQGSYRIKVTVLESKWIVLDALQYRTAGESNVVTGLSAINNELIPAKGSYTITDNGTGTYDQGTIVDVTIQCTDAPIGIDIITLFDEISGTVLDTVKVDGRGSYTLSFEMPDSPIELSALKTNFNELQAGEQIINNTEFTFSNHTWHYSFNRKGEMQLPALRFFNKDTSASNTQGAWVESTFTGSKIEIFGETYYRAGSFKVELFKDGESTPTYEEVVPMNGTSERVSGKVFEKELEPGTYRVRMTVNDYNKYIVLDAIKYRDTTGLASDLQVTGLQSINQISGTGDYDIAIDGSANSIMEGDLVIVTLFNKNDNPDGDEVILKNGEEILASDFAFDKGTVYLSFFMPSSDVNLSVDVIEKPLSVIEYWVEDALTKASIDQEKPEGALQSIAIDMAKKEYEGSQIILRDTENYTIDSITINDLTSPNGGTITADNVQYNFVDYEAKALVSDSVKGPVVSDGSNGNVREDFRPELLFKMDEDTKLPDPLSNDITRFVKRENTQPIYFTVYVPQDTPAGVYTSDIVIETTKENITVSNTVPISVTVYDVEIPDVKDSTYTYYNWASELGYSFQFTLDSPKMYYHIDERYTPEWWQVIDSWTDSMIEHRQNMYKINTPQLLIDGGTTIAEDGTVTFNWSRFDEFINRLIDKGFTQFGGMNLASHWNGIDPLSYGQGRRGNSVVLERNGADDNLVCKGYPVDDPRTTNYLRQYMSALAEHLDTLYIDEERGITVLDNWYQHVFDEPSHASRGAEDWAYVAREVKKYGVIKDNDGNILKTIKTTDADASGILEQNFDLIDRWVLDLGKYADKKDKFDAYIKNGKNIALYICTSPKPPYLNRFISQETITGLLTSWYAERNDIPIMLHWGFNAWQYASKATPGDAQIVYPDKDNLNLKKSLRYEAMRDGIEDYELLHMLRADNPTEANQIIDSILQDAKTYTTDPTVYREARRDLLRKAEALN